MMNKDDFIKVIQTRKYKDINLYLRFSIENKPLLKEKVALLCKMIGDISNSYPTKSSMAKAKDLLYGISIIPSYKIRSNIISLSIHYSFINPKFVDATILDYQEFINETLFNSIIDDNSLLEAKRNVKANALRRMDKPASNANERFIEIVSKDNPHFEIYGESKSFIDNLDLIKIDDLIKTYKKIINNSQLDIYLCGDISERDINYLTNYNFDNRKLVEVKINKAKGKEKRMIVDKKDISQSYLIMVYQTPFNKSHKDFFAWFIGNVFLGVVPTSLLFTEIREKMSLCYSISVFDYKNEGLVKISTSIDGKNKNKTISAIEKQIKRLIDIDYDPSSLQIAKALICNSLLGVYDDLDSLIDYYYESKLSHFNYSIEEYCANIMRATPEDIARVFKQYKHYFNYILLGTKDE